MVREQVHRLLARLPKATHVQLGQLQGFRAPNLSTFARDYHPSRVLHVLFVLLPWLLHRSEIVVAQGCGGWLLRYMDLRAETVSSLRHSSLHTGHRCRRWLLTVVAIDAVAPAAVAYA